MYPNSKKRNKPELLSGGNLYDKIVQQKGKLFSEEVGCHCPPYTKQIQQCPDSGPKYNCIHFRIKSIYCFIDILIYCHIVFDVGQLSNICMVCCSQVVVWYLYQIASAVSHIHKVGVLHR